MDDATQTPDAANAPASGSFAPNPMAVEFSGDSAPKPASPLTQQPVDTFDAARHGDLLDRLEHELALVDAALSHIDDGDLDAADSAIKELARHNDDGQVALPLR